MGFTEIIIAVISGLTGSGLTAYFAYRINSRKTTIEEKATESSQFQDLLSIWKQDNERLRGRVSELEEQVNKHVYRIAEMENQLVLLESSHHDLPIPQWLKDLNGRMLSLNTAYESMFLTPHNKEAKDYIGKTDEEVWGADTAKAFRKGDKKALTSRRPVISIEPIPLEDEVQQWEIIKYPRYAGRAIIGIGGIAVRKLGKDDLAYREAVK